MRDLSTPPEQMPALVLAYIGDAIYEVYVRRHLVSLGITKMNKLHKQAVSFVNANTQAQIIHSLEGQLEADEENVVKRGRNAKSGTAPKNVDMIDYRYGTAFEALFGYLYLKGKIERMEEIFETVVKIVESDNFKGEEGK